MLLAILSRHADLSLADYDVFVNLVGGIEIAETATDLPLALALASSLRAHPLPTTLVAFGELGLTGEVRPVAFGDERLRELTKLGFTRALLPRENLPRDIASRDGTSRDDASRGTASRDGPSRATIEQVALIGVSTIAEALAQAFRQSG